MPILTQAQVDKIDKAILKDNPMPLHTNYTPKGEFDIATKRYVDWKAKNPTVLGGADNTLETFTDYSLDGTSGVFSFANGGGVSQSDAHGADIGIGLNITNENGSAYVGGVVMLATTGLTVATINDSDVITKFTFPAPPTADGDYKLNIASGVATWVKLP